VLALVLGLVGAGVDAAAIAVAAAAAAPSTSVDPRAVPLLKGPGQAAAPALAGAKPNGDFSPLASVGGKDHFDPKRSQLISRSQFAEEYRNPDGTHTIRQSANLPLNVKDSSGAWHPIDIGLTTEPSGRVRVNRHPLSPSLAPRGDDPALVSVDVEGKRAALSLEQATAAKATVDGGKVGYADVRPDTDLTYDVTPDSVKETIRLKKPPAPGSASWRFRLNTAGLTPRVTDSGEVAFVDGAGTAVLGMPPVETWDSSGTKDHPPALTGGRYQLEQAKDGWVLTVSVDEAWLRDPKRVYPVGVDPTFAIAADRAINYKSDGFSCDFCDIRFGNPLDRGFIWRSVFHFDYSAAAGRNVVSARLDLSGVGDPAAVDRTYNADLYHATALDINGVGEYLGSGLVGQVGRISDSRFADYLRRG
jgi:hypothetical protein